MKVNMSIAEVRKVCEALLEENGDVFEVSRKTNVSTDDVRRIKEKKYMKSISDSYFDSSKWGGAPESVREPDPVQLVIDDIDLEKETKVSKPEPKKTTKTEPVKPVKPEPKKPHVPHNRSIEESTACRICELLCEGTGGSEIGRIVGVSPTIVSDIRRKKTWKAVSDLYFELLPGTSSDIKVIKTGEIFINKRDNRRNDKKKPTIRTSTKAKVVSAVTPDIDIIAEIEELATKYIIQNKTIDELPESIREKVLEVIKNEVSHMSLTEIKELTR